MPNLRPACELRQFSRHPYEIAALFQEFRKVVYVRTFNSGRPIFVVAETHPVRRVADRPPRAATLFLQSPNSPFYAGHLAKNSVPKALPP